MIKKSPYIRCPRCELNYIQKKDKFCTVCKAEMSRKKEDEVDELDMEFCPVCRVNFIGPDEVMCASCLKERSLGDGEEAAPLEEAEDEWESYVNRDENEFVSPDEETGEMVTITDFDEEELDLGIDHVEGLEGADLEEEEEEFGEEESEETEEEEIEEDIDDDFDDDDDDDDDDDF